MQAAKGLPFDDLLTKFGAFYNDFDIRLLDAQLQTFNSTLVRTEVTRTERVYVSYQQNYYQLTDLVHSYSLSCL